ncbi:MAG TPA: phosphate ABC transporter, permease protein PstA, partial [Alcanivorax sp.]|nr:phosphate ABC transporter, permease protein PstA [Alcanivorax sp.]
RRAQWLGGVLDMLAAVPSIVYGLFGYQFFAISLGLGFSILSGGLALALMVLPLMIRSAEQALRAVPLSYRQAGEALSISRWGWVRRILVPQAAPGIAVGIILSIGRALAETAVLLFTAGYVLRRPDSVMDSGRALSVHIYDLAMNVPGGMPRAAATGLVLVAILVILNLLVRRWLRPAQGVLY